MTLDALQHELEKERAARVAAEKKAVKLNEELNTLKAQALLYKNTEEALGDTNTRLTELISNLYNGVLVVDEHRKIIIANQLFCSLLGIAIPSGELIGKASEEILEDTKHFFKDPGQFEERVKELLDNKKIVIGEELELLSGQTLSRDYIPVFSDGNYKGHLWKLKDVTESKKIEASLQAQKKFYEQILNNIPRDIAVFNAGHRYLYVNPMAISNPELREWMIGKNDTEYCLHTNKPISIAENRSAIFNSVIESKTQKEWEEQITKPDGTISYHLRTMFPVLNDKGEVEIVIGYGLDITNRKKAEEQIKLSEKRYRDIFSFSQAWICTHDMQGKLLSINPAACKILDYKENELIGHPIASLMPEKARYQFSEHYLKNITDDGKAEGIMGILNRKGKKLYLLYQNYLVNEPGSEPYVIGFAQNITERIYADEALKRSEEKSRGIIENMNLGMMEMDTKERIIYANQRFCKMSGYELNELITKKATDLFLHGAKLKMISNQISRRQYGVANNYEIAIKTKTGEDRWWLTSATPLFNSDGSVRGTIGIHLDITDQKKLEQQLREAKQDTDKASKSKDIFLTNMSHEIRTPLNAIMGLGKLLSKSELNTQQKNYLSGIESASENLLGIINDLLDFSKIEAGKISIEQISFNLDTICRQTINILTHKTEEKGLILSHETDENIAPVLMGDPFRIKQVFMNMLGNAIKFTEKGSISINTALLEQENDRQKVLVTIIDTGVGIKEEYLDNLFDKFTQEDVTVARKFGGTGLGMSITKQLMELMGGTINVQSKKNVGTTISLVFDFKIGTARVLEKKQTIKNETAHIANKKILLVEDNNLNRLLAHTILTEYGALVSEASNGEEAVEFMRNGSFDIVLMDIQMPVMDGIQATKIIRKEINDTVPIIALTANVIKNKLDLFMDAGMNDHILKPYDELTLVNPIAKWLNKNAVDNNNNEKTEIVPDKAGPAPRKKGLVIERAYTVPAPAAENAAGSDPLYDLAMLKGIARNDLDFIKKMLQLFIDETPAATKNITEAYKIRDLNTVRYIAHRIKPSIHNMGISKIKNEITRVENMAEKDEDSPELEKMIGLIDSTITLVVAQLKSEYNM